MKQTLIGLLILLSINLNAQVSQEEANIWRKDLKVLAKQLSKRHVNLYHTISKEEFDAAVAQLDTLIPSLSSNQILVRFAQLVALVGDGHTSFLPGEQLKYVFHYFPIRLWSFSDGIYVISTTKDYQHLLGKRVIQIDDTAIEDVYDLISTTIGADNDMEYTYTIPFQIRRPELLNALGISNTLKEAEFFFNDGSSEILAGGTEEEVDSQDWFTSNKLYNDQKLPSARIDYHFATTLIIEMMKRRKNYWFKYLEMENALFFQYNVCWNQKGQPTFEEVTNDLMIFMDNNPIERLIIDLRQNPGGEPNTATPLIDQLKKRVQFSKEGRIFVLVGRRTFSAALTNAVHMRKYLGARIVGESPRGKPNNPSEGRDINLKNTKTWATVSTQFVERDPTLGDSEYLPVDIRVVAKYEHFKNAQDQILIEALGADLLLDN